MIVCTCCSAEGPKEDLKWMIRKRTGMRCAAIVVAPPLYYPSPLLPVARNPNLRAKVVIFTIQEANMMLILDTYMPPLSLPLPLPALPANLI